ncbi:MAG: hypothetical protein SCH98_10130 [Deferrisomatales bacterium]|nr:hypothetical protein [Deferrisomatales bacterium]
MSGFQLRRLAMALALFLAFSGSPTRAFHDGGVGACKECHRMNRLDPEGTVTTLEPGGTRTAILLGSDPSSTCLRCHARSGSASNVLSADGSSFTPGGDFYWLTRSYSWTVMGREHQSPGRNRGHNVVAAEFGLGEDGVLAEAPGGSYPAASLSCTSCHDPHAVTTGAEGRPAELGQEEAPAAGFRLLGGVGYARSGSEPFREAAPVARASSPDWRETDSNHTAYGSGMSEWCANCHPLMLAGGMHSTGRFATLDSEMAARYNRYVKTGDHSGDRSSAYLALVPFEAGTSDTAALDPSSTAGPEGGRSNVMCLTCHRAHASAFEDIGRWDFSATFLAASHPAEGDVGVRPGEARASYYGRDVAAEFGPDQRSLCNKCHALD